MLTHTQKWSVKWLWGGAWSEKTTCKAEKILPGCWIVLTLSVFLLENWVIPDFHCRVDLEKFPSRHPLPSTFSPYNLLGPVVPREGMPEDTSPPGPAPLHCGKVGSKVCCQSATGWHHHFLSSLPQLVCCGVEHLVNSFAPLSTKAVAHSHILQRHIWESQAVRRILSCAHIQLCSVWI